MHVTPKREVGTNVVRSGLPQDLLAFKGEDNGEGSRIEEDAEEIRRRHDWRCRLETVPEPYQTDRRQCDHGEHDCERPNVWKSHSRGAEG
jgi:hypothetical protein